MTSWRDFLPTMVFVACEFETGTELDADEELEVVAGMELMRM